MVFTIIKLMCLILKLQINKRIFHSLGTKDKDEAIEQQVKLDKKYQSLKK